MVLSPLSRFGRAAWTCVVLATLVACGASVSRTASVPAPAPTSAQGTLLHVAIPASVGGRTAAASVRGPRFVSSGTNGLSIVVTLHSTGAPVYTGAADLSATSSSCSLQTGGGRSCAIFLPVGATPTGDGDDFTMTAYDTKPLNGQIPTTAQQLAVGTLIAQPVVSGAQNGIAITLNGTPASVTFPGGRQAVPSNVGIRIASFPATVKDAAGQTIVGAFSSPVPVALTVETPAGHALLGITSGASPKPTVQLNNSADAANLYLQYDGAGGAGYIATVGATGSFANTAATGAFGVITVSGNGSVAFTGSPPVLQFQTSGQSAVLSATESNYSGAFVQTNTCTSAIATVTTTSSSTYSVLAGAGSGSCTITIGDGTFSYVPILAGTGPASIVTVPGPGQTPTPTLAFAPSALTFLAISSIYAQTVVVSEANYSGTFTVDTASTCLAQDTRGTIVSISPSSGATSFSVTPNRAGACSLLFRDAQGIAGTINVSITSTTLGGQ